MMALLGMLKMGCETYVQCLPTLIPHLDNVRIKSVSAGHAHAMWVVLIVMLIVYDDDDDDDDDDGDFDVGDYGDDC